MAETKPEKLGKSGKFTKKILELGARAAVAVPLAVGPVSEASTPKPGQKLDPQSPSTTLELSPDDRVLEQKQEIDSHIKIASPEEQLIRSEEQRVWNLPRYEAEGIETEVFAQGEERLDLLPLSLRDGENGLEAVANYLDRETDSVWFLVFDSQGGEWKEERGAEGEKIRGEENQTSLSREVARNLREIMVFESQESQKKAARFNLLLDRRAQTTLVTPMIEVRETAKDGEIDLAPGSLLLVDRQDEVHYFNPLDIFGETETGVVEIDLDYAQWLRDYGLAVNEGDLVLVQRYTNAAVNGDLAGKPISLALIGGEAVVFVREFAEGNNINARSLPGTDNNLPGMEILGQVSHNLLITQEELNSFPELQEYLNQLATSLAREESSETVHEIDEQGRIVVNNDNHNWYLVWWDREAGKFAWVSDLVELVQRVPTDIPSTPEPVAAIYSQNEINLESYNGNLYPDNPYPVRLDSDIRIANRVLFVDDHQYSIEQSQFLDNVTCSLDDGCSIYCSVMGTVVGILGERRLENMGLVDKEGNPIEDFWIDNLKVTDYLMVARKEDGSLLKIVFSIPEDYVLAAIAGQSGNFNPRRSSKITEGSLPGSRLGLGISMLTNIDRALASVRSNPLERVGNALRVSRVSISSLQSLQNTEALRRYTADESIIVYVGIQALNLVTR